MWVIRDFSARGKWYLLLVRLLTELKISVQSRGTSIMPILTLATPSDTDKSAKTYRNGCVKMYKLRPYLISGDGICADGLAIRKVLSNENITLIVILNVQLVPGNDELATTIDPDGTTQACC